MSKVIYEPRDWELIVVKKQIESKRVQLYRKLNAEKVREYDRQRNKKRREKIREYQKKYQLRKLTSQVYNNIKNFSLKCANYDCKNYLTNFEITRINPKLNKLSRFNFCRPCRYIQSKGGAIDQIRCHRCNNPTNLGQFKKYCNGCLKENKKEASLNQYYLKRRSKLDK